VHDLGQSLSNKITTYICCKISSLCSPPQQGGKFHKKRAILSRDFIKVYVKKLLFRAEKGKESEKRVKASLNYSRKTIPEGKSALFKIVFRERICLGPLFFRAPLLTDAGVLCSPLVYVYKSAHRGNKMLVKCKWLFFLRPT
jgi:hypothetical protein